MNFLQDQLSKAIDHLIIEKERFVLELLKKKGIVLNFESERKRRFKSLAVERQAPGTSETWFYNDGTEEGLKIVTFKINQPCLSKMCHTTIETSYEVIPHI